MFKIEFISSDRSSYSDDVILYAIQLFTLKTLWDHSGRSVVRPAYLRSFSGPFFVPVVTECVNKNERLGTWVCSTVAWDE